MANVTLLQLKQKVSEEMKGYQQVVTSANGTTALFKAVSLGNYSDYALEGKWAEVVGGSANGNIRQIRSNTSTEGHVQVYVPFDSAIVSGTTIDLHDHSPTRITEAINQAIRSAFPDLSKYITDDSLIGGNLIPNSSFEDWASSSYPDYWRNSTDTTLSKETSIKLFGSYSLKVTGPAGGGYAYLSSDNFRNLLMCENSSINLYVWAYCSTANKAYAEIVYTLQNGTTGTLPSTRIYHSGNSGWEKLEMESNTIPDDIAEIQIRLGSVDNTVAYFDQCYVNGGVEDYVLPTSISRVVAAYSGNAWDARGMKDRSPIGFTQYEKDDVKWIRFGEEQSGHKIELTGYAENSELSDNTDTLSINQQQERMIVIGACAKFFRGMYSVVSSQHKDEIKRQADYYEQLAMGERALGHKPTIIKMRKWSD